MWGPDTLMVSPYLSSAPRLTQTALITALFSSVLWMTTADAGPLSVALPGVRAFPESSASTIDGTLFIGRLGEGGIVRANPRTGEVALFVALGASGSRSITGVLADEASKTLWACSNDLSGRDDNLYVTTYAAGELFRIDVARGRAGRVTKLHEAPLTLAGCPSPLGQRSLLLVEGAGTLDRVEIEGDEFKAETIRGGFRVPTSATRVASTAWVSEGQLSFFIDRSPKHQSPSLPFRIYAVPLRNGQSQ